MEDFLKDYRILPNGLGFGKIVNDTETRSTLNINKTGRDKLEFDYGGTNLRDLPLAMAYVPMQRLQKMYDSDVALNNGTLFADLDKPFLGRRV